MKNINTNKVKPSCYGQKVCKVIRSVNKARDVVHDNKLVIYFFTHYAIIYNTVFFLFFFFKKKKPSCILKSSNVCVIHKLKFYSYVIKTRRYILFSIYGKSYFCQPKHIFFMSQNILFFAIFYKNVVFLQPVWPTISTFPSNVPS